MDGRRYAPNRTEPPTTKRDVVKPTKLNTPVKEVVEEQQSDDMVAKVKNLEDELSALRSQIAVLVSNQNRLPPVADQSFNTSLGKRKEIRSNKKESNPVLFS